MALPTHFPDMPPMPPLTDRLSLAHMLGWLRHLVFLFGVAERLLPLPLVAPLGRRLQHLSDRFDALLAQYRAGTLHPRAPRPAASPQDSARPDSARPDRACTDSTCPESGRPAAARFPQQFGWLQARFQRLSGIACTGPLTRLLADPEMLAVLDAAPDRAGRLLRPLCHMLGITPPPAITPPPRPRRPRRRKPAADAPSREKFEPMPPSASPELVARWRLANPIVRDRPRAERFDITRLSALRR